MAGVTHDELRELLREHREDLKKWVVDQLTPVHQRLERIETQTTATNGRLRDAEGSAKEHTVQIKNLEREVFPRPRKDDDDEPLTTPARMLSERDLKIVWFTLTSAATILGAAWKLLPLLKRLAS